jgi:hypothetical protein
VIFKISGVFIPTGVGVIPIYPAGVPAIGVLSSQRVFLGVSPGRYGV